MNTENKITVGLFGIGLDTYWKQFTELKNNLMSYQERVNEKLSALGAVVVDGGLVDNPDKAGTVAKLFKSSDTEIIFLFVATYALSSTVLPVIQQANVPVIVLNLQPVPQLDYASFNSLEDRGKMTGIWLEHCQACSAPEIACVFNRAGIDFHLVTGYLEDEYAWREIKQWVKAARVCHGMCKNRVGVLGHYYGGMLDVYSDLTQQSSVFGNHFEILEMCELYELWENIKNNEIRTKMDEFREKFEVSADCEQMELERAARTSVALDRLIANHKLGSMAYYYEGRSGSDYEDIVTSVIAGNTLLTGRGIPIAGECEVKNVQAMKIMDLLNAGGSFSEFYLTDFKDDVVFLGHDGPAHFAIAEGRVNLVPLMVYHGKPGKGLSIQMTVKHGPATLLSVVQRGDGSLLLLTAEGESVPGPVLAIGNTNSRYRFSLGARGFTDVWCANGPAHHCAIGVGHIADEIDKLGKLLGIEVNKIC